MKGSVYPVMEEYELGEIVGYGSFSTVYKAKNKRTGAIVAIKLATIEEEVPSSPVSGDRILAYGMERIEREIGLWKPLDHVNLCRLLDVIIEGGKVAFVMDYAKDGDLLTLLSAKALPISTVREYFGQLCEAVRYLHSKDIIHGDIKLENILLIEGVGVKLSDFGLARRTVEVFKDNCGTVEYAAPELLSDTVSECPFKADMWALGVALYALMYRQFPFDGPTPKILKVRILTMEPIYSDNVEVSVLQEVLKSLLQKNPEKRPSIKEVCDILCK